MNWLPLDVLIVAELTRYYRWLRKARTAAEAGSPLPDLRSMRWLNILVMMQGLTSAIVNPNDLRLMETIKSCDIFKNNELYSDSYLDA